MAVVTPLDTIRQIETPEGIDLPLSVAGPVVRALALAVDLLVRAVLYLALGLTVSALGNFGTGLYLIGAFLLEWLYPVAFEVLGDGQTPGKARLGIQVLNDDGTPVTWDASLVRNLVRFVDLLPAFYFTGLVAMLGNADFKRLGDLAAGTWVVHVPRSERRVTRSDAMVKPLPVPPGLAPEERRAIVAFGQRADGLNEARAEELARLLTPLLPEGAGSAADRLRGMAVTLAGQP